MSELDFKAFYGAFDTNMIGQEVIDVTDIVAGKFLADGKIKIPAKTDFNCYFGNPVKGKRKFLQLKTGNRKHNIIEDSYNLDIEIDIHDPKKSIKLIYYAYINRNSNWEVIISGQLSQLKGLGLLDEADVYVHITDITNTFDDVIGVVKQLCTDVIISTSIENNFEYPAIRMVYDLAKETPDCIFIYLHSKGMSYNIGSRKPEEITLLTRTFEDWRRKLESFVDEKINKMGLFPAIGDDKDLEQQGVRGGWIWFNFWYAKGKYLLNCDEPLITENRYFFEHWLGLQNGTLIINNDCHNIYEKKSRKYLGIFPKKRKRYFTPSEASQALLTLTEN